MRYWLHFWWQCLILHVEYTICSLDVNLQSRQWQSTIQHIHENDNFWCWCCCCCLVTNFIYELNAIAPTWLPKSHSPTAIKATKCWIYSLHPHTVWSSLFFSFFFFEGMKLPTFYEMFAVISLLEFVLMLVCVDFCCWIIFQFKSTFQYIWFAKKKNSTEWKEKQEYKKPTTSSRTTKSSFELAAMAFCPS